MDKIVVDGLQNCKEFITDLLERKLSHPERDKIDCLMRGEFILIDNLKVEHKDKTLATFILEEIK